MEGLTESVTARAQYDAFESVADRLEKTRFGLEGDVVLIADVEQELSEVLFPRRNLEAYGRVEVLVGDHQVPDHFVQDFGQNGLVAQPVEQVDI